MPPGDNPTVEALLSVIATLNETIMGLRHENGRLVAMVEGMTKQLDELLRDRDEERRAEVARLREEARRVAEANPLPPAPLPAAEPHAKKNNTTRHEHGRSPLPEHLERDIHPLKPATCDACGSKDLVIADTLVSEEVDYVPARVRVRRTERTVCRCNACHARVTPPQPPMPFDRASCTFALMAWIVFTKCGMFVPLDRQLRELERLGVRIPSATATRWWKRGADLLLPVAECVRLSLLAGDYIRTDGTGLRVIYPKRKGAPKQTPTNGQILVFGDDEHAVFVFTLTKEGHHALAFLTMGHDANGDPILWEGTITADAVSSHDCLFTNGDRVESGCNAHGLRKFRDDQDKAPLLAAKAMGFIGRVYDVEAEARAKKLQDDELLEYRRTSAQPIVEQFKRWLDKHITDLLPKNPVRKAMQYYINHWEALTRFLKDPAVPLDNNWSERELRKVALFRNNSLFASGEEGAVRLCTALTLIGTCRLIGVDPCAYLEWAMQRVVPHPDNRGIRPEDLTPASYKIALA